MRTPVILVALLLLALSAGVAFARGGDGGDYSGDGSSSGSSGSCYGSSSSSSDWGSSSSGTTSDTSDYDSSSGGDGGDGDIVGLVVILAIFGLAFGATVYDKLASRRRRKTGGARKNRKRKSRPDLSPLRRHDPNFSPVLFTAFAHLVYVKYHESRGGLARHNEEEFAVAPYISRKLRQQVHESNEDITQVIVGDMYIDALNLDNKNAQLCVNFKSNVVCKKRNGRLKRMLMQEQFLFKRALDSYTREPERVLALGCPSCGSKQEPDIDGRCPNCGEISGDGRMDWQVTAIHELEKPKAVKGSVAGGGGVEPGTDLPTVIDPGYQGAKDELLKRDPEFNIPDFTARVQTIFLKLQEGWTKRDESILRPFELDHVFDTHRIWLERYREEGVINVLKDIKIEYIKPVKIEHDAWFDSITVRIRASMLDYKEDERGRHLSGGMKKRKVFTEYHTLVRRAKEGPRKAPEPLKCPQCGAPLDRVSQLGVCGYCDTRITTGEFDWVLALITQDEEYAG